MISTDAQVAEKPHDTVPGKVYSLVLLAGAI